MADGAQAAIAAAPSRPSFGVALKRYRLSAGLTQEDLAARARLSARAVSDLERGVNRAPRPSTLALLARALRLGPADRAALTAAAHQPSEAGGSARLPHNLPSSFTSFVGREREVRALRDLVRRDGARLVTLTGAGGTGKTRLALEVAADLLPGFSGGVRFVALAAVVDPEVLLPAVAQALGVREAPGLPAARARDRGAGRPGDAAPPGQLRAPPGGSARGGRPPGRLPRTHDPGHEPGGAAALRRARAPRAPAGAARPPPAAGGGGPRVLRGHPAVRRAGTGRAARIPARRRRRRGGGGDLRPPGRASAGARARRCPDQAAAAADAAGAPGGRASRGRLAPAHRGRAGRPGPPADAAGHHRLEFTISSRRTSGPCSGAWPSSPGAAPWRPPRPSAPGPAGTRRAATSWRGSLR